MVTAPKWPTVEEQLRASDVPPGSALEQLVRDNQDFQMLRPEEAHDDLEIPFWLRVWWRKRHPTARHVAGDPSGGYPKYIHGLLRLMLANPHDPAGNADDERGQP